MTWAISVPILVFLGLSVLDLGPMYETDTHHRLMLPPYGGGGIIVNKTAYLFKLHLLGWAADGILRTGVEFVRIMGGGRQNGRSRVAIYATDVRQTDVRQKHRLMHPPYGGGGIIMSEFLWRHKVVT